MTPARLRAFLARNRRVALDTSVFIYQLEANPKYLPLTDAIFRWLERPGSSAVTSAITMTELLVHPHHLRDDARINEIFGLLSTFPHLDWVSTTLQIADEAARARAHWRLRTPDAIQFATGFLAGASGLITNNQAFENTQGLDILLLDTLLL